MGTTIPKTMEIAYRKLYARVLDAICREEGKIPPVLSSFFPMKGTEYDKSVIKLMIVGRSTNGWFPFNFESEAVDTFVVQAKKAITDERGFSCWLYPDGKSKGRVIREQKLEIKLATEAVKEISDMKQFRKDLKVVGLDISPVKGITDKIIFRVNDRKLVAEVPESVFETIEDPALFEQNLRKVGLEIYQWKLTTFFKVAKKLLRNMGEEFEEDKNWFERIVWTNLYPISPLDEGDANAGNATGTLKEEQEEIGKILLREQIDYFKPTHILFMTDWEASGESWFSDFAVLFSDMNGNGTISRIGGVEKELYKDGKRAVVVAKGKYNDIPVVVTSRPDDTRSNKPDEQGFAQQVKDAFDEIEKTK